MPQKIRNRKANMSIEKLKKRKNTNKTKKYLHGNYE